MLAEDRHGLTFCPARAPGRKVFTEQGKDGAYCPITYTGTADQRANACAGWRRWHRGLVFVAKALHGRLAELEVALEV